MGELPEDDAEPDGFPMPRSRSQPPGLVVRSPATHAILAQLKAGEIVYQAGELPETLRVSRIVLIIKALNY